LFYFYSNDSFLSWLIQYPDIVVAQVVLTTETTPPQKRNLQAAQENRYLYLCKNFQIVKKGEPSG
jgi:hypothetical protein